MAVLSAFNPSYTQGQTVTPSASAASSTIAYRNKAVCLTNLGTNVCYIRIGRGTIAATTADYPVPVGAQTVVTKGEEDDTISYISPLGTTLHFIVGEGF